MTMPTLETICQEIQDVVGAVSGVRVAPDVPLETNAIKDVTAFVYPGTGQLTESTDGIEEGRHTIHLQIITPRRHLRTDFARVIGLGDTVPRALLLSRTLSSSVLQIGEIRYTFGLVEFGGEGQLGWMFEVDVLASGTLS